MKNLIKSFGVFLLFAAIINAQTFTIGPKLGVNFAMPKLSDELKIKQSNGYIIKDATTMYSYTDNIKYDAKTSIGFSLFFQSDIKLSDNLGIVGGIGVFDYNSFKVNQEINRTTNNYNRADTSLINTVNEVLKTDATYKYTFITLEALFKYSFDKLNLMVGPSIMFNVDSKVKTTSEYDDANYLSPVVNLKAAVNYDVEVSDNLIIAPELNFAYPLTNAREDDYYKAKLLNIGFSLVMKYSL
ncbi:MAG TPA: outer membrane beta-barrel protein [Ignavibacteriales bacterium]|nr:outer membrane beta-barrel protein [Ignavibacteriales bacterium]HOL81647.1 outer membrane beta-barrel protein [Ignavibacteriales bacterium]HOM65172.1 outer membrane beta-barrel protein [Ignavibacteriales bacterium]HPD66896.1 outer membrane beta-barrel protein [Ignavibacteriales bacterium]HPP33761.1 outer membrane beta-barrel protein [Ignavibacteriales bacterium]